LSIGGFFAHPSPWGIGLAVIFGAFWLFLLRPLTWRRPESWLILLVGAFLFAPAIAWIQQPLQTWTADRIVGAMGIFSYQRDIFWTGIPVILISGLVQEGAKLLPVAVYWLYRRRSLENRVGLSVGALSGVGFGIFEAQWVLNGIFASGWNWTFYEAYGFLGISGFWERFFAIAFHTSSGALAGWGLAKGKGWQFYLLASLLHFLFNYLTLFYQKHYLTSNQIEIVLAIFALLLFGSVFWLRWRHSGVGGRNTATA
jgi:RsiW-degrading membrane proteinase PrsW (M82 family)